MCHDGIEHGPFVNWPSREILLERHRRCTFVGLTPPAELAAAFRAGPGRHGICYRSRQEALEWLDLSTRLLKYTKCSLGCTGAKASVRLEMSAVAARRRLSDGRSPV
jgi:hypothetical protein